ncbi:hypothetical protein LCGC14_1088660 [marine sediment metagenome]|uniref:Uncharacterized protein n=1 Tax=marine sediment metagenome TaxID=412755 RepID=A0A0F9QJ49_9ZZZZ
MEVMIRTNEGSLPHVYKEVIDAYAEGLLYYVIVKKGDKRITYMFSIPALFLIVKEE